MRRTRAEVEHAINTAAAHAWEGHGWQGMYEKLGISSELQLRDHMTDVVWAAGTECFAGTYDREFYYDRTANTCIVLNYRKAGTCLVMRDGPQTFARQYRRETGRFEALGIDKEAVPRMVLGGVRALHVEICAVRRDSG